MLPSPCPPSQLYSLFSPYPLPLRRCSPSLEHQVSTGLGVSFPTEVRQGGPLLHMCHRPAHPCMLFGWWLCLWDLGVINVSMCMSICLQVHV